MTRATPAMFTVEKSGQPELANSAYFVLDVVNDSRAREALAYLGRQYDHDHKDQLSQECFDLLKATEPAFRAVMESRQPKKK